jgi:hypothetical protein
MTLPLGFKKRTSGAKQAAEKRTLVGTFAVVGEIVSKEVCAGKTRSRVGCSAM